MTKRMGGIKICMVLIAIMSSIYSTKSSEIDVKFVIGLPRLNTSSIYDYYFICTATGMMIQWETNDLELHSFVGGSSSRSFTGTRNNFTFVETLVLDQASNGLFMFTSVLIVSCQDQCYLDIVCRINESSFDNTTNMNNKQMVQNKTKIDSVFLQYLFTENIITAGTSKTLTAFICGVQNRFMLWRLNGSDFDVEVAFSETDAVGRVRQRKLQDGSIPVDHLVVLMGDMPYSLVTILFVVDASDVTATCKYSQNIVNFTIDEHGTTTTSERMEPSTASEIHGSEEVSTSTTTKIAFNESTTINNVTDARLNILAIVVGTIVPILAILVIVIIILLLWYIFENKHLKKEIRKKVELQNIDEDMNKDDFNDTRSDTKADEMTVTKIQPMSVDQEISGAEGDEKPETEVPISSIIVQAEISSSLAADEKPETATFSRQTSVNPGIKLEATTDEEPSDTPTVIVTPTIELEATTDEEPSDIPTVIVTPTIESGVRANENLGTAALSKRSVDSEIKNASEKATVKNQQDIQAESLHSEKLTDEDLQIMGVKCLEQSNTDNCDEVRIILSMTNRHVFRVATSIPTAPDGDEQDGFYIGTIGNHTVGLVKHKEADKCLPDLKKAIQDYFQHAKYIVVVGLCYCFSPSTNIGDVLISNKLLILRTSTGEEGKTNEAETYTLHMNNNIKHIFCEKKEEIVVKGITVRTGKIASGPLVYRSKELREIAINDNCIGGEAIGEKIVTLQEHGTIVSNKRKSFGIIIIKSVIEAVDEVQKKGQGNHYHGAQAVMYSVIRKIKNYKVTRLAIRRNAITRISFAFYLGRSPPLSEATDVTKNEKKIEDKKSISKDEFSERSEEQRRQDDEQKVASAKSSPSIDHHSASCSVYSVCDQESNITAAGAIPVHGPQKSRCPSSNKPPASLAVDPMANTASIELHSQPQTPLPTSFSTAKAAVSTIGDQVIVDGSEQVLTKL